MKQFFYLAFFFLITCSLKATHNRSGEILYKRIAPFTKVVSGTTVDVYTYSITVIKYTDDGLGVADRCVDTVYFGDGTKGVAPRTNGSSSNCNCGTISGNAITCGSIIINNPNFRVKQNIYSIVHTYPGPGSYLIRSVDPNRNANIHNIPNSVNIPFYLESLMIISSSIGANSSPVLLNPPIEQATVGVCFYHNPGAADIDGDSLSYELSMCRGENGQTVPGYAYPELGFNGSYSINPVTGILTWCTPQFIDQYSLAFIVKEWRKNTSGVPQIIGYVLRDMQVLVRFGVVGINDNNPFINVSVAPNPFTENLRIDFGGKEYKHIESSLYSTDGRQVAKIINENTKGSLDLFLENLEPGIYSLSVKTEEGTFRRKVIKN